MTLFKWTVLEITSTLYFTHYKGIFRVKIQFFYLGRRDEGFEDSLDKSIFYSRVENLDLKLGKFLSLL